jgi:hypothetical protein
VPHPCQNEPALAVIGGHSGDIGRHSDLDSSRYQRRPNKPDKEVIRIVGVKQWLTVATLAADLGHRTTLWPDFGRTTALNVAAYCASLNSIPSGQRVAEQVEDTPETLYGSEGWLSVVVHMLESFLAKDRVESLTQCGQRICLSGC